MAMLLEIKQGALYFIQALQKLDYYIIILKQKVIVSSDSKKVSEIKHTKAENDKSFYPSVLPGVWLQGKYMTQFKAEKSDRVHFSSLMHLL